MSNFVKYENISTLIQKIADKLRNVGAIMDDAFSDSSTNGVQNKVIKSALDTIDTALSGKSDTGHKHSAADITSGTLTVARGGTGNTSVDTTPTSGSTKMCTSGGILTALNGKQATLTVTSGQATRISTYCTSGTISWFKYGRAVMVQMSAVTLASWTDGDKVLTNAAFPKPLVHSYGSINALNGTEAQLFAVTTNGALQANGGVSHVGEYYGQFWYISAS